MGVLAERDNPVTMPIAVAARRCFPQREADMEATRVLSHGGPLPAVGIAGPYAVFDPAGGLVAIVRERDGRARPEVVLTSGGGSEGRH
jgi:tRNA pseudouridine55 synthase